MDRTIEHIARIVDGYGRAGHVGGQDTPEGPNQDPNHHAKAWTELQEIIEPWIVSMVRSHRAMRDKGLLAGEDDIADVRAAALGRLSANQFANLRSFMARNPATPPRAESFHAWLYGLVDYAVRDHVRRKFGRAPKAVVAPGSATPVSPVSHVSHVSHVSKAALQINASQLDEDIEQRLIKSVGVTTRLTVGEILTFVARTFSAEEVRAVELHYGEGRDYAEIASVLGLQEPMEAKRLLRRLNARLRYRFAEQGDSQSVQQVRPGPAV